VVVVVNNDGYTVNARSRRIRLLQRHCRLALDGPAPRVGRTRRASPAGDHYGELDDALAAAAAARDRMVLIEAVVPGWTFRHFSVNWRSRRPQPTRAGRPQ